MLSAPDLYFTRVELDDDRSIVDYLALVERYSKPLWGDLYVKHTAADFRIQTRSGGTRAEHYTVTHVATNITLATAELIAPQFTDIHETNCTFLVDPAYQGYGIGQQVATFLENRSRELGRSVISTQLMTPGTFSGRSTRFVHNRGYELMGTTRRQDLALPLPAKEVRPLPTNHMIHLSFDVVPEPVLPQLAQMWSDYLGAEILVTPEDIRLDRERAKELGFRTICAIAQDSISAELTGFSEYSVRLDSDTAEHEATYVVPSHRGKGIGSCLASLALLQLGLLAPNVRRARQFVGEDDIATFALNDALGYKDVAYFRRYVKDLNE